MSATGKLSKEAKEAKNDIMSVAQVAMQELSEGIQLRSNLSAAFHSMAMSAINNIRA
jgi:hypothetical protein